MDKKVDIKDTWIKARISSRDKDILEAFCVKHRFSISELIRTAIAEYMEDDLWGL